MADILIKNIEIPKDNKRVFLCIEKDGEVGVFEEKKLIRFTEAHELPPHGDLKDMADIWDTVNKFFHGDCFEVCKLIRKFCPTIVEATE